MSKMLALGGGALVGIACFLPLLSLTLTFGALSSSGNVHATDLTLDGRRHVGRAHFRRRHRGRELSVVGRA